MKKHKLGLNKLALSKSKIAELNRENAKGGCNTASTNPFCIATGYYDETCDVTALCNTANHCGASNACPPATANCNPNQTVQFFTCIESC
ncbi:hypothetical protein [Kordia sp.]|uniref:hypothetical protein n=1 Tax=Kordia sp. TaxID=1965332 RepID=UPI0025BB28CB|nr:hypothetical protein [Kordia sp.]MCH2192727.1 hypothetical protein [Kordia sp.]